MRLISTLDAGEPILDEKVFRNSSIGSAIAFAIFLSLFLAVVGHYLWYSSKFSINYFGYAGYLWFGFWFGFIANLSWSRLRSSFLPSNWLLKISPGRLLIKFRSFQNYFYPEADPVVIDIHWRDIDWVRMTKETSSRTTSDTTETRFYTYLDIKLNLSDVEIKDIKQGLANELKLKPLRSPVGELRHELFKARKNKAPKHEIDHLKQRIKHEKTIKHNKKQSGIKYRDYPVSLVDDSVLRIRWNGIKPNIKKTLAYFSNYTQVEDKLIIGTDSTVKLSGKELDDMILDRITKGDKLDAIALVKKHYGFDTTEAKKFIDELTDNLSGE